MPSGPRSRSMNSRTSRPRSPTRQITLTCGAGRAGDHAQQGGLADARAGEDAQALAAAARHERVERAHAERDALVDARAHERVGRGGLRGARADAAVRAERAEPVERAAEPVQRAAEQRVGDLDAERAARWPPRARPGRCPSRRRAPSGACARRGSRRPRRAPRAGRGPSRSCTPRRPRPPGPWPRRSGRSGRARARGGGAGRRRAARRRRASQRPRSRRAQRGRDDLAGALELGLDAGVDVALGRAHDGAAAADAPLRLDLAVLDAAERRRPRRPSPRARGRGRPG